MRIADIIDRRGIVSALVEVALIIFGVLAALALQGWWEGRQERAGLVSYLVALQQEIKENDAAIDAYLRTYLEDIQRVDDALTTLADQSAEELPNGFTQNLGRIYFINDPQLSLNAYEDMISSGSLRLLDDASLRKSIADYVDLAYGADNIEQETWRLYYNSQFPFLVEHGILSELRMNEGYFGRVRGGGEQWFTPTPQSPHAIDPSVFKTAKFWNLLFGWKNAIYDQGFAALRLQEQIDETLPLLNAEIDRLK